MRRTIGLLVLVAALSAGTLAIAGDSSAPERNCDSSCQPCPLPCSGPCGMCG